MTEIFKNLKYKDNSGEVVCRILRCWQKQRKRNFILKSNKSDRYNKMNTNISFLIDQPVIERLNAVNFLKSTGNRQKHKEGNVM